VFRQMYIFASLLCRVLLLFLGGFLKGFLFEPGDCMATDFPLFVFFFPPPELISAPRTGSSVNKFCRFKKKKQGASRVCQLKNENV
jgi:hypothetical protein